MTRPNMRKTKNNYGFRDHRLLGRTQPELADAMTWLAWYAPGIFSAVMEERNMAKLFPDTYPPYKRATKMLIPYIL